MIPSGHKELDTRSVKRVANKTLLPWHRFWRMSYQDVWKCVVSNVCSAMPQDHKEMHIRTGNVASQIVL